MTPLAEIALLFLKLGATAFGGPAAHIALMEEEVVRRRKWLTENQFLDLLGAANLIPGPNSTELAIHIGFARAGWRGLLTAGVCFILPATLIVLAIAAAYVSYGTLPAAQAFLYGVKPVVVVVILQALWNLLRKAVKSALLAVIGVACVALLFAGVHELVVLFGSGVLVMVLSGAAARWTHSRTMCLFTAGYPIVPMLAVTVPASGNLLVLLFLSFLKIGSVLFGSGYVLLAFLRSEFVVRLGWLTEAELLDATAVGQLTPGPVSTTATFIGYLIDGPAGGVVATVGIFLPAFVFVALISAAGAAPPPVGGGRPISRRRQRRIAGADGLGQLGAWSRVDCGLANGTHCGG